MSLFIIQNLLLLSISFYVKYNSTVINYNLIKNFQASTEPKAGFVIILNEKLNRNFYNLNLILFKSFNKSNWMSKIVKKNRFNENKNLIDYFEDEKKYLDKQVYKVKYIAKDFSNECFTVLELQNELTGIDLIKQNYLFNQNKFFKINKTNEKC